MNGVWLGHRAPGEARANGVGSILVLSVNLRIPRKAESWTGSSRKRSQQLCSKSPGCSNRRRTITKKPRASVGDSGVFVLSHSNRARRIKQRVVKRHP